MAVTRALSLTGQAGSRAFPRRQSPSAAPRHSRWLVTSLLFHYRSSVEPLLLCQQVSQSKDQFQSGEEDEASARKSDLDCDGH